MRRKLLTVLAVLLPLLALTASYAYAQEEPFDVTNFVPPIIAAAAPLFAYAAVWGAKQLLPKIPKPLLLLIPSALGLVISLVEKQMGGDGSVIMIALWTNMSIVLHELQQKFSEWASGGEAKNLFRLFVS